MRNVPLICVVAVMPLIVLACNRPIIIAEPGARMVMICPDGIVVDCTTAKQLEKRFRVSSHVASQSREGEQEGGVAKYDSAALKSVVACLIRDKPSLVTLFLHDDCSENGELAYLRRELGAAGVQFVTIRDSKEKVASKSD